MNPFLSLVGGAASRCRILPRKVTRYVAPIDTLFSSVKIASHRRLLSSSSSDVAPASSGKGGGFALSGFFQRLSSFLIGAGLTALGTQYYIYAEIRDGNLRMLDKQKELEARLAKLETSYSASQKK